jgi:hypothetical protein
MRMSLTCANDFLETVTGAGDENITDIQEERDSCTLETWQACNTNIEIVSNMWKVSQGNKIVDA